ncbi:MAG: hypothetical protein ABI406_01270 [Ktedonobacteraceae bacterium]
MVKFLINILIALLILLVFSSLGAIIFPALPAPSASVDTYGHDFFLLIIPALVMAVFGHFLGRGIRSLKNSFESLGLTFVSAFIVGGVLALMTSLNFGYSAHINFNWLGTAWYDPLFIIFILGAPIMLACMV